MAESTQAEKARTVVTETLVSEFELEREKIVPAARLREDLGLDSLDGVDLIVALEKSLSVRIPENDARQMRTVGDIHAFIDKAIAAGAVEGAAPNAP